MSYPDELTVEYAPISSPTDRCSRRQGERDAVMWLLRQRFGEDVTLLHDAEGAPSIDGFTGYISISHCNGLAALAIHSRLRIGIDVERARAQLIKIKHKYLTDNECERFTTIEQLLRAWTVKEAVYKAAGIVGLSLTAIEITDDDTEAVIADDNNDELRFKLYSTFNDGVMTTVAIPD